jgi:poly(A) polymerase
LLLAGKSEQAKEIAAWHVPRLPIGGGALIKRGVPEGPVVAKTLRRIEAQWLSAGFPSGAEFEEIVSQAVAAAA